MFCNLIISAFISWIHVFSCILSMDRSTWLFQNGQGESTYNNCGIWLYFVVYWTCGNFSHQSMGCFLLDLFEKDFVLYSMYNIKTACSSPLFDRLAVIIAGAVKFRCDKVIPTWLPTKISNNKHNEAWFFFQGYKGKVDVLSCFYGAGRCYIDHTQWFSAGSLRMVSIL